jgi:hypothetical protein
MVVEGELLRIVIIVRDGELAPRPENPAYLVIRPL